MSDGDVTCHCMVIVRLCVKVIMGWCNSEILKYEYVNHVEFSEEEHSVSMHIINSPQERNLNEEVRYVLSIYL